MRNEPKCLPAAMILLCGAALMGGCSDSGAPEDATTARYVLMSINGNATSGGAPIREAPGAASVAIYADTLTLFTDNHYEESYLIYCVGNIDDECTNDGGKLVKQMSGAYTITNGSLSLALNSQRYSVASGAAGSINLSSDGLNLISPPDLDNREGSDGPDDSSWQKIANH
jgi:hypothetical protein